MVSNRVWATREFSDCSTLQTVLNELRTRTTMYKVNYEGQVVLRCPTDSFEEYKSLGKTSDGKKDKYEMMCKKNHFVWEKKAYISYTHVDELAEILTAFNMDEQKLMKVVVYNKGSFMH
jgi:hypothetical protein